MDIKIIYEDEEVLVIDKPSGVVVNRSESAKGETVQDWAEERLGINGAEIDRGPVRSFPPASARLNVPLEQRLRAAGSPSTSATPLDIEEEYRSRGGVVHRLDKETSGILLIAKNPQSFLNLKNQFKDRIVEKEYFALAHGEVKPEEGVINVPVGRLPYNRTKFGVIVGGREAETQYQVLSIKYFVSKNKREPLSYLRLNPKTGRTHQIRVHLKYINHPIFADPLYAGRKVGRDDRKYLSRLFLHASKISFNHPVSLKKLTFESPLPKDLQDFLGQLTTS